MIVTLISQCEKKAISRTQRILDAFANRIGDRTWQTIITEEGLDSLRMQLRQSATKNTAVACHWVRSKRRSELLWIVGNRDKFNDRGFVPVNITTKSILHNDWENNWQYLPAIKALVGLAALFHDLGKAGNAFQTKLKQHKNIGDPYRHEWVSVYLLYRWITNLKKNQTELTDADWIDAFSQESYLKKTLKDVKIKDFSIDFSTLPPIALLLAWLILSHHKLPTLFGEEAFELREREARSLACIMKRISAHWGYQNDVVLKSSGETIKLSALNDAPSWKNQVIKWIKKLACSTNLLEQSFENGSWRLIALHAHLCLTLGDHYFSSLDKPAFAESDCPLYANTKNQELKQHLDDHLIGVCKKALKVVHFLPQFTDKMQWAHDLKSLAKPSPPKFSWQDKATKVIKNIRETEKKASDKSYFIVNMASTGQGKTIANAKIMRALSPDGDSVRYILALGLRTLTLQTGSSYREDIHLKEEDLAVVIGSETINTLYENNRNNTPASERFSSESAQSLLDNKIEFTPTFGYDFLDVLFQKNEEKLKAFLYKPVLCCTIDHMMPATEAIRGGRFILPTLRLLTSDLIIDEIDDFSPCDLLAISRLVHLAGMLGRKVMISSATIPPDLAAGLFDAYQKGRLIYSLFKGQTSEKIHCLWVDEFKTDEYSITTGSAALKTFQSQHDKFIHKRCEKLKGNVVKQLAYLIPCKKENVNSTAEKIPLSYFETIKRNCLLLHTAHAQKDPVTEKMVSFGLIRMANVKPCIQLSRYLLNYVESEFDIKVLTYHSRELLLLRNSKEKYLDTVLRRKQNNPRAGLSDQIVRKHLTRSKKKNVLFLVVSTPVEEVGRDHDFDWAIVEPSSMRSIIQLAGRVRRHRDQLTDIEKPNVGVLQFNIRGLLEKNPAFIRPGFEGRKSSGFSLITKDMSDLVNWQNGQLIINAIPRISKSCPLQPTRKLADLEHEVIAAKLLAEHSIGPGTVHGWVDETWFLTGISQQLNSFRDKNADQSIFIRFDDNNKLNFYFKNDENEFVSCAIKYNLSLGKLTDIEKSQLWLQTDLITELEKLLNHGWKGCQSIEEILQRSPELSEVLLIQSDPHQFSNTYIESLGLICGEKINHD